MKNPQQAEDIRDRWRRWLQTISFFAVVAILAVVLFLSATVQHNERLRQQATAVAMEQTGVVQTRHWPTKHAFQQTGAAGETIAHATWDVEAQHAQETLRIPIATAGALELHKQQTLSAAGSAARQSTPVAAAGAVIAPESAGQVQELARWGKGTLSALLWSPDGQLLAVGTGLGVDLYQAFRDYLGLHLSLLRHLDTQDAVSCLCFSPDGVQLAVGLINQRAQLWDVSSGILVRSMEGTYDQVVQIRFAPDGSLIVVGVDRDADRTPRLYVRQESDDKDLYVPAEQVTSSALSPDRTLLAYGLQDGRIDLWRIGGQVETSFGTSRSIGRLLFSPDGTILAVAPYQESVQLWSVADGTPLATLNSGTREDVYGLAFTADGKTLIIWQGETLSLWSVPDGQLQSTLDIGYPGRTLYGLPLMTIAPDPRGDIFALADNNVGQVSFWDVDALTTTLVQGEGGQPEVEPGSGETLTQTESYSLSATVPLTISAIPDVVLQGYMGASTQLAFTPDGQHLLTVEGGKQAWLWDLTTGVPRAVMPTLETQGRLGTGVATQWRVTLSADGSIAFIQYLNDGNIFWDVVGERVLCTNDPSLVPGLSYVSAQALSPAGIYLAAAGNNRVVVQAACKDGVVQSFDVPEDAYVLAFSPDAQMLAAGLPNGQLYIWQAVTGELIGVINANLPGGDSVAFRPYGRLVALAGTDAAVYRLKDLLPDYTLTGKRISTVAFSPDGQLLVIAESNGTVSLCRASDGAVLATLPGGRLFVSSVAFTGDGRMMAIGSYDGTIGLWGVR